MVWKHRLVGTEVLGSVEQKMHSDIHYTAVLTTRIPKKYIYTQNDN